MLRILNTLTKKVEEVQPIQPGLVRMYTCGPTVYRDAHIGNLRTYLMADWIRRVLEAHGLQVQHVKNITDVGVTIDRGPACVHPDQTGLNGLHHFDFFGQGIKNA